MQDLYEFVTPDRPLRFRVLAVLTLWSLAGPILVWTCLPIERLAEISRATGGLISGPLMLAPVAYLMLWLILIRWGRMRYRDLAFDGRKMMIGIAFTLVFWAAMQIIQAVLAARRGAAVDWHPSWSGVGVSAVLGRLVGQLVGTAMYEEIVFRHVAISQLSHLWRRLNPPLVRLVLVVIVTQLFFWVMHFPMAMGRGVPVELLLTKTDIILTAGFLFTWAYLQTRNLWIAVGIHAMTNAPTPLITETHNAFGLAHTLAMWVLLVHLGASVICRLFRSRRAHDEP